MCMISLDKIHRRHLPKMTWKESKTWKVSTRLPDREPIWENVFFFSNQSWTGAWFWRRTISDFTEVSVAAAFTLNEVLLLCTWLNWYAFFQLKETSFLLSLDSISSLSSLWSFVLNSQCVHLLLRAIWNDCELHHFRFLCASWSFNPNLMSLHFRWVKGLLFPAQLEIQSITLKLSFCYLNWRYHFLSCSVTGDTFKFLGVLFLVFWMYFPKIH